MAEEPKGDAVPRKQVAVVSREEQRLPVHAGAEVGDTGAAGDFCPCTWRREGTALPGRGRRVTVQTPHRRGDPSAQRPGHVSLWVTRLSTGAWVTPAWAQKAQSPVPRVRWRLQEGSVYTVTIPRVFCRSFISLALCHYGITYSPAGIIFTFHTKAPGPSSAFGYTSPSPPQTPVLLQ